MGTQTYQALSWDAKNHIAGPLDSILDGLGRFGYDRDDERLSIRTLRFSFRSRLLESFFQHLRVP
jgi:hypothetical protein